jgi:hypothetical protein
MADVMQACMEAKQVRNDPNAVPLPCISAGKKHVWCKEASSRSLASYRSYGQFHALVAFNPEKNCPGTLPVEYLLLVVNRLFHMYNTLICEISLI